MGDPFRTRFRPTGYAAARRIASRFNRYRKERPEMSYVRWSTPIALPESVDPLEYYFKRENSYWDIPTSDFYIYDHVGGFVAVHVAGNRHRPTRPFTGKRVSDAWLAWLDEGREKIDHPDAGKTFDFPEMADAIAKVEQLIGEGFLAPAYLLDAMREELDAQAIPTEGGDGEAGSVHG